MSPSQFRQRQRYTCKGKMQFRTIEGAQKRLLTLHDRGVEGLQAYQCWSCERWHVGHKPKYEIPTPK